MESMINLDGAGLILATSFGYYTPFVVDMAKEISPGSSSATPRLYGTRTRTQRTPAVIFGYLNQGHYVDGVAAGLSTKSNKLGSSRQSQSPACSAISIRSCWGRRRSTPTRSSQVIFTGDWSLPVREAEAASALVDAGCDVITCHVDSPKVVIETAEKRGVKTCGHNASQAPLAPKGFITGAEYKWETIYKGYAADLAAGKTLSNFTAGGIEADMVTNTPFGRGRQRRGENRSDRSDRRSQGQEADLCRTAQG